MNKVVAHFLDGQIAKGLTMDFVPAKDRFHLIEDGDSHPSGREIALSDLKGLFFVKDLEGDLGHAKSNIYDPEDHTVGRRIRVRFKDGEVLQGFTVGYQPNRTGFFVIPADRKSNTERSYIVTAATAEVSFL